MRDERLCALCRRWHNLRVPCDPRDLRDLRDRIRQEG